MTARPRRLQGERGAALILAIAFMVVIGGISGAVLATTTSGLQNRVALDTARNREYAADGAIERSIASARVSNAACPSPADPAFPPSGPISIHVDCSPVPTPVTQSDNTIEIQNDIVFTACLVSDVVGTPSACPSAKAIISAQINFQGTGAADQIVTYVQSWSVNR